MAAQTVGAGFEHEIRGLGHPFTLRPSRQKTLIRVRLKMTGLAADTRGPFVHGLLQISLGVPDRSVTVKTTGVFNRHVLFVHQLLVLGFFKCLSLVMAGTAALWPHPSST